MKKILVLLGLIGSMSVSAETIKTDNPNRYLKNYVCGADGYAKFNVVNKTNKKWSAIKFDIYDSDGDPVDNFKWYLYVNANSGKKQRVGGLYEKYRLGEWKNAVGQV